jgi:excisionase family DNA binding protein
MADSPYHTTHELADRLRVSAKTVRRWLREGRITGLRTPGGWRFDATVVEAALAAHHRSRRIARAS